MPTESLLLCPSYLCLHTVNMFVARVLSTCEIDIKIRKYGLSNEATIGVMAVELIKLAPSVKLDYRHLQESGVGNVTIIMYYAWVVHELGHFLENRQKHVEARPPTRVLIQTYVD